MQDIFNPLFWEQAWTENQTNTRPNGSETEEEQTKRWNHRADSFAANNLGKKGTGRRKETFDFINRIIDLKPGMKILDIGCGPGSFAIPFAEMGLDVTALDPAEKMLDHMMTSLPSDVPGRITPVLGTWETSDPQGRGWHKQFDLVFASLSPGITDVRSLSVMSKCSSRWCYLSTFAGPRQNALFEEIWPLLFDRPFINHPYDIIFPFNYLYAQGFHPYLNFVHINSQRQQSVDEVLEEFFRHTLWLDQENGSDLPSRARALLEERAKAGSITQGWNYSVGMMIWDVTRQRRMFDAGNFV